MAVREQRRQPQLHAEMFDQASAEAPASIARGLAELLNSQWSTRDYFLDPDVYRFYEA